MSRITTMIRSLTPKERTLFIGAGIVGVVAGATLLAIVLNTSTHLVPASGGEYTEGMVGQPTHINPVIAENDTDKSLVRLLYAPLTDLAEKIEPAADGRSWKVRLKENLVWSDGTPLTSDDVVFTVQKIQDPESASPAFPNWQGVSVNRGSLLEVQFNLVNPYAFFSQSLESLYVVPKHLFADIPVGNWRLSQYNLKPVGSGPYIFESSKIRADGFIEQYNLTANPRYGNTKPFIERFAFQFFTKEDDAMRAFNAAQVDGILNLSPQDLSLISRPYETLEFGMPSYYAVFLNQSTNLALQDLAVRRALDLAIDRELLVKEVFSAHADPAYGPIPQSLEGALLAPLSSSTDPGTLLEKNGWKMASSTFREKRLGNASVRLHVELAVPRVDFLSHTADLILQAWRALGVDVVLTQIAPEDVSNVVKNRKYQALLFGNILNTSGDLFSFWHSSQRFSPGLNLSIYSNKKADTLLESVRETMDEATRTQSLGALQKTILNDEPAIFLYSPHYLGAATKDLHISAPLVSETADVFSDVKNWYLKTARVMK